MLTQNTPGWQKKPLKNDPLQLFAVPEALIKTKERAVRQSLWEAGSGKHQLKRAVSLGGRQNVRHKFSALPLHMCFAGFDQI